MAKNHNQTDCKCIEIKVNSIGFKANYFRKQVAEILLLWDQKHTG